MGGGSGDSRPSLKDLDLASVRSTQDLKAQADILAKIADIKMEEYMDSAPEKIQLLRDKGVPKSVLFGTFGTVFTVTVAAIIINYGFQMLSVFVDVLQPLYYTFKALETQQKDDDTVWLTYWMVHGVFFVLENTLLVPITRLLPAVYFFTKIVLQFWMVNFEGSTVIYQKLIAPFFRRHEKELEQTIDYAKKEVLAVAGIKLPTEEALSRERDAMKEDEENDDE